VAHHHVGGQAAEAHARESQGHDPEEPGKAREEIPARSSGGSAVLRAQIGHGQGRTDLAHGARMVPNRAAGFPAPRTQ
jgi:hypothetical protein